MVKIIKLSTLFVLLCLNIYSAEYSIGISVLGIGPTVARGGAYNTYFSNKENRAKLPLNLSYTPALELNSQIDIFKYFGFDFGIGFAIKSYGYTDENDISYMNSFYYISAPILLRGQYEFFDRLNVYILAGPKFNFNMLALSNVYNGSRKDKNASGKMSGAVYNIFNIDVNFSLGVEYRVATSHYLGIRLGYDMNVYSIYKIEYDIFNNFPQYKPDNIYLDTMAFSLTYRYVFGRPKPIKKDKGIKSIDENNIIENKMPNISDNTVIEDGAIEEEPLKDNTTEKTDINREGINNRENNKNIESSNEKKSNIKR